jgi:twitching motility protein PilT
MAMRPIDRFVNALFRQNGDELILETGKPGRVRIGRDEKVLLAQNVRTDQIELLLRDIIPMDMERSWRQDGELSFPYRSSSGPVVIRMKRASGSLFVYLRPYVAQQPRVVERSRQPVAAIELVPTRIAGLPAPTSSSSSSPPPAIQRGARSPEKSGDTGPIELDMATGSLPDPKDSDIQELASMDIVAATSPVSKSARIEAVDTPPQRLPPPLTAPKPGATAKVRCKIDPILLTLIENGGSDLHLTSGLAPRMRKDGDICGVPNHPEPLESHTIEAWLMEIAPVKSRAKFAEKSDADYGYELPGTARIRVNAFRDRRGVGGVMRVIPAKVFTAEQLRLPKAVLDLCALPKGLVVVTGPTGSGKSTTLAGMIDYINKTRAEHIITIEDPVEFVHQPHKCLINQREVHSDTESFSSGLRAALREDPDIILVGEMRDLETISIAVETAETGHLVFGTLHTTTAISTIDRIIDSFPTDRQQQIRVMLSSALKGVIAQSLLKKVGGGRVAALEVLLSPPAVANLIREGKTHQLASVMQTGRALGMQTLNDALYALVKEGMVEEEEALSSSLTRLELKQMLERGDKPALKEAR